MKTHIFLGALCSVVLSALPSQAQTITYEGTTSSGQMPGSPADYIFFNSSNFSFSEDKNLPGGSDEDLTSFSMSGGVDPTGNSGYSYITPPGGASPTLTGGVVTSPGIAFQLVLGTAADGLNPNFNYNDFNVYVMISNTGGFLTDQTVGLTPYFPNDPSNPDNSSSYWGSNSVTVTDTNTNTATADYLEFHVVGLEAAGGDLAMTANFLPNGSAIAGNAYIGGVSFVSIAAPEPSSYALMGFGLLALLAGQRFRRSNS